MEWLAPLLAPFKAILALVIGQRGVTAAARLIVDIDPRVLAICQPVVMREGRAFIWSKRGVAHARLVRGKVKLDWTSL